MLSSSGAACRRCRVASVDGDMRDVRGVVAPGDALGRRGPLDGRGVIAVEVVPGPRQEGVGFAVRAAQQHRVYTEPGGEGDRAIDLMPVLADLRDGRVPADHRHDALVLVVERLGRLSVTFTQDVVGGPNAGLLCDRAQLRQGGALRIWDVRGISHRVHVRVSFDGQVRQYVYPPSATGLEPDGSLHDGCGRLTATPDDSAGADRGPVVEFHPVAVDG